MKSKKKVNTSADVQSSAQSQVKSKKRSSRPQIVLYTYINFTPRKFYAFACGGGGRVAAPAALPLDMHLGLFQFDFGLPVYENLIVSLVNVSLVNIKIPAQYL